MIEFMRETGWLGGKKLNSFTWIGNSNSGNKVRNQFNDEVVPNYRKCREGRL